jgi:hypothetical protein
MKKQFLITLIVTTVCYFGQAQTPSSPIASPLQVGAFLPGIINSRDYANPGTSGLVFMDYNVFFTANDYIDRNGDKVNTIDLPFELGTKPLDIDVSGYMNFLALAYISPELPFLGNPRYLGFVSPYYASADYRIAISELNAEDQEVKGGAGGWGDLSIAPLFLTWAGSNDKFDITAGYMFTLPTGRYETGADDNIGLGYWNHVFQLYGYYYLMQKATALYLGNTFETHSEIKDIDVRPGNRYTLEYGLSQYLSERLEVNVQGGHTWQVGKDSGSDVYWDTSNEDRYSTIGVGLGYWPVTDILYLNLKWWTNYGIRQHFKFNAYQLQLIINPGWLVAKADKN